MENLEKQSLRNAPTDAVVFEKQLRPDLHRTCKPDEIDDDESLRHYVE